MPDNISVDGADPTVDLWVWLSACRVAWRQRWGGGNLYEFKDSLAYIVISRSVQATE